MTGNPIRVAIRKSLQAARHETTGSDSADATDGETEGGLRLFVFGGSQGAMAVNQLVADAAAELGDSGAIASIVHQTGERDLDATRERYEAAGIKADCRAFIKDMAAEYARADLVISRSGATTVAELGVVGVPAILVPYPYAADNHQEINAAEMVEAGAAKMFRQDQLTAAALAGSIRELAENRQALRDMGSAMKALGRPQAASDILDWCSQQMRAKAE